MNADYVHDVQRCIEAEFAKLTPTVLTTDDYTVSVSMEDAQVGFVIRITGIQHVSHHVSIPVASFERGTGMSSVENSMRTVVSSLYAGKNQPPSMS